MTRTDLETTESTTPEADTSGSDCPGDASRLAGQSGYTCIDPYFDSAYATVAVTVEP